MIRRSDVRARVACALVCLGIAVTASAHVQYYDLNQGRQIADLTPAGKSKSTREYGQNPAVAGITGLNRLSGRPLMDKRLWTRTYQVATGAGSFSGVKYTPTLSTATVNINDVNDWGWAAGTQPTLGDSHEANFFNFRLERRADVTITWLVHDGQGNYVDGGFSLYGGVMVYQGHDDAREPLNPASGVPPVKKQSPLDTGTVKDAQGIASAPRNTISNAQPYVGQFNARKNWGQTNPAGNWSNLRILKVVNARNPAAGFSRNSGVTLEKLTVRLLPGNYTIVAGGALGAKGFGAVADSFGVSGLKGRLQFRAVAR